MPRLFAAATAIAVLATFTLLLGRALVPASASGALELELDCDQAVGIQSTCAFSQGVGAVNAEVALTNGESTPVEIGAFDFEVVAAQQVLTPIVTACDSQTAAFDCNPDFNQSGVTGAFTCSPPPPEPDIDPSSTTAVSRLACHLDGAGSFVLAPGASVKLGTVHYQSNDGGSSLSLRNVSLSDTTGAEIGSCAPVIQIAAVCGSAAVSIGPPTATPTPTNTPVTNPSTGPFPLGLFLDCDVARIGVQGTCVFPSGTRMVDANIVFVNNSGGGRLLSGFDVRIRTESTRPLAVQLRWN